MGAARGIAVAVVVLVGSACGSDEAATVTFTSPRAGAKVAGAVQLVMAADGILIEEAGEPHDGAGHFHVIADAGCEKPGVAIPKDADHVHFGKGQSEGVIYLEPGRHELCLQVGDGVHSALDVTDRLSVQVGVATRDEWCAVAEQASELIGGAGGTVEDFAVQQGAYENARRLLAQLSAAIDLVDSDARSDVHAMLALGANIATAFTTADTEAEARQAAAPLVADDEAGSPGARWVQTSCGVNL
jgi:hypothetical protein